MLDYGFSVKDLTKDLARRYNVEASSGVIVTEVQMNSAGSFQQTLAYSRGITPGDIITKLNNKPVSNVKDFIAAVTAFKPDWQWRPGVDRPSGHEAPELKVLRAPQ